MANKQDINGALSIEEVTKELQLRDLKSIKWLVQGTSGITGEGIMEGLDWMISTLLKKK